MSRLFTVREILTITGGRLLHGDPATPVSGFAFDSRRVRPGDTFVALVGERVDGHDFAGRAAEAGAVCALVGRALELPPGCAQVLVPDPLIALGQLGKVHRERHPIPLVGITGSVGKTTTKEIIAAVLARRFEVFRNPGNFNSEVGLPIGMMALGPQHQVAVQEMGMRALGEISYLVSIAQPTIAVVTNVGPTHLELLGTIENIALAKSELVTGLPSGGVAVLNADDHRVAAMADRAPGPVWFYGFGAGGRGDRWVTAEGLARDGESGQRFRLRTSRGEVEGYLPAPGRHAVLNAMAAVAVGLELGISLEEVAAGLADYRPAGNRMRILNLRGIRILDDTYNAAPISVIAALGVMRDLAGEGRCIAALGSMFELGPATEEGHRQVGREAARLADQILTVGDLARTIAETAGTRARHCESKPALAAALLELLKPGDTLLIKGSRGLALEDVVAQLEEALR